MGWEEALVARLAAAGSLALVPDANIAFFERPRGAAMPALTLTGVSPGVAWTHDGPDTLVIPGVQFDAWGRNKSEVAAVARGLRAEMERLDKVTIGGWTFYPPGVLERERQSVEDLDGTEGVYRWMQDYSFAVGPAA